LFRIITYRARRAHLQKKTRAVARVNLQRREARAKIRGVAGLTRVLIFVAREIMNWYKNLKIGRKLFLAFVVTLLFAVGVGVFMIATMLAIDSNYADSLHITQPRIKHVVGQIEEVSKSRMILYEAFQPDNTKSDLELLLIELEQKKAAFHNELDSFIAVAKPQVAQKARELTPIADEFYAECADVIKLLLTAPDISVETPEYRALMLQARALAKEIDNKYAKDMSQRSEALFDTALTVLVSITEESAQKSHQRIVITIAALIVMTMIVIGISLYVSAIIRKPIIKLVDIAGDVARGNINVNIDTSQKDEIGALARSFAAMTEVINGLVNALNDISHKINTDGDIDARLDEKRFQGAYADVAKSTNVLVSGIITDVLRYVECFISFGNGDMTADIPKMPGKKALMNDTLNTFRGIVNSINNDAISLVHDASKGLLTSRVDVTAYKGDWAKLAGELNGLMDTIAAPINEINNVMSSVAAGDFSVIMNGDYKGEFLALKDSVNTTVTNISSYIDEITYVLLNLAAHDLDQSIKREYLGAFSVIKDALTTIIGTFNKVIGDIHSAAGQVTAGAKQISDSSMALAGGTSVQAASIEELNASVITINERTVKNAENAENACNLSIRSKKSAAKGDDDMKRMLASMEDIEESSNSISKVIKVIDDIAFQTNLLALNAAVEAARAGTYGKGFAVVAEEVRSLAIKSRTAAGETAKLIETSNKRVADGALIVDETVSALKTILEDVGTVANIITGISESSKEQTEAIGQITIGLQQITQVVQDNSATSEETASAAQELSSQSELLNNMVGVFKMKK